MKWQVGSWTGLRIKLLLRKNKRTGNVNCSAARKNLRARAWTVARKRNYPLDREIAAYAPAITVI